MPLVSVVVATRNYGRYLAGAVRSALGQTCGDLEVILVDDGSTDDTPAVVRPYLSDPRVRYLRTDGLGQSRAKNLGIQHARGPFVAFLDGDDEWLPTKLERQLPLFADPAVGVVFTRRITMDANGVDQPIVDQPGSRGVVYDEFLKRNPVCFSSVVVRREVFDAVGMFDPALPLAIDYDLWLRVARHYAFDYVDEPLVRYRSGHGSLSGRLVERLTAVMGILRRSLGIRGNAEVASPAAQAEAWGQTCRTMGYVLRDAHPRRAASWYVRAARHDGDWGATLRAMVRCLWSLGGGVKNSLKFPRKSADGPRPTGG